MTTPFYRPGQQPEAFVFMWDAVQLAKPMARESGESLFINIHVDGWRIEPMGFYVFGKPLIVRPNGEVIDLINASRNIRAQRNAA